MLSYFLTLQVMCCALLNEISVSPVIFDKGNSEGNISCCDSFVCHAGMGPQGDESPSVQPTSKCSRNVLKPQADKLFFIS